MEKEIWRAIKGYEGLYEISNRGLIHILPRKGTKDKYFYGFNNKGYLYKKLCGNGKPIVKSIHHLVYETFVGEMPKGYDVHHINHIKTDNRVENLCLIEDSKHAKLHNIIRLKPVLQYTLDGEFVAEYESSYEADKKTGVNQASISKCCNKKYGFKTAGGYIWKYKNVA